MCIRDRYLIDTERKVLFLNFQIIKKGCIVSGSKYVLNPDLRSQRIVNISQYASVDFCKKFWFLGELGTII